MDVDLGSAQIVTSRPRPGAGRDRDRGGREDGRDLGRQGGGAALHRRVGQPVVGGGDQTRSGNSGHPVRGGCLCGAGGDDHRHWRGDGRRRIAGGGAAVRGSSSGGGSRAARAAPATPGPRARKNSYYERYETRQGQTRRVPRAQKTKRTTKFKKYYGYTIYAGRSVYKFGITRVGKLAGSRTAARMSELFRPRPHLQVLDQGRRLFLLSSPPVGVWKNRGLQAVARAVSAGATLFM